MKSLRGVVSSRIMVRRACSWDVAGRRITLLGRVGPTVDPCAETAEGVEGGKPYDVIVGFDVG